MLFGYAISNIDDAVFKKNQLYTITNIENELIDVDVDGALFSIHKDDTNF